MKIGAIFRRELFGYFRSPLGFVVLGAFLVLAGYFFYTNLIFFVLWGGQSLTSGLWRHVFLDLRLLLLMVVPLTTMRLFAEERKLGTMELLWTYPVTDTSIVVGKFLASVVFLLLMVTPTLVYPGVLALIHPVDAGPLVAAYVGTVLMGMTFIACGMAASSVTENQLVAAVLTYGVLLLAWFLTWNEAVATEGTMQILLFFSLFDRFYDFAGGAIDTEDVAYFVVCTAFFLFLTLRILQSRSWRGV